VMRLTESAEKLAHARRAAVTGRWAIAECS
jgi:hypothetical protein